MKTKILEYFTCHQDEIEIRLISINTRCLRFRTTNTQQEFKGNIVAKCNLEKVFQFQWAFSQRCFVYASIIRSIFEVLFSRGKKINVFNLKLTRDLLFFLIYFISTRPNFCFQSALYTGDTHVFLVRNIAARTKRAAIS